MMLGYLVDVGNVKVQIAFQNWIDEFNVEHSEDKIWIVSIIPTVTNEVVYVIQSDSGFAWGHLNSFYEELVNE